MNAQCHWYINEAYVHYVCCASIMLTLVVFHMSSRRNNNDNEDEVGINPSSFKIMGLLRHFDGC